MVFTYDALDEEERRVLNLIAGMRSELSGHYVGEPRRWTGLLARLTRARALRASNSIEGINVSAEDAVAAVDGEQPAEADRDTWRAVDGYRRAMDYVLRRLPSPDFQFTEDLLLAVHFMICEHDAEARPGQYRVGWVGVHNTASGELLHEGAERDELEALVRELLRYANDPGVASVFLRAAMVHLNLVMIHPFKDGNGRVARCLQTAVLASDGIVAPVFSSIEEYIGRNQQHYYDVLSEVGGGRWRPGRDCKPWVRFCILGHYRQADTLRRRVREFESAYNELQNVVDREGLPERTVMALLQAAFGGTVRNSSYRVSADVSFNLASRDLKQLVSAGLLMAIGERRGRVYRASAIVAAIREKVRLPGSYKDPFATAAAPPRDG